METTNTPLTYNNATYISIKDVATALNMDAVWKASTQTVVIKKKLTQNGLEQMPNYFNYELALKYQNTIYMTLVGGADKYNERDFINYDSINRTISFVNTKSSYDIVNEFKPECDGFVFSGRVYLKESIFQLNK